MRIHRFIVAVLLLQTVTAVGALAAVGSAYLLIPNGVRETAMGETGVSHSRGGAAGWWNPALMCGDRGEVEFQLFRWFADGKGSFGGARFQTGWGGFGIYYFNLGMDGFEARDRPGPVQAEFSLHQSVIAGGAAFKVAEQVALGVVYKTLFDQLYEYREVTDGVFDFGAVWRHPGWSVGAAVVNVAGFEEAADPLPLTLRAGLAHYRDVAGMAVTMAGEGSCIRDGEQSLHLGLEAGLSERLFLRAGYMHGHDSHSYSFGVGLTLSCCRADVAVTPFDYGLGTVWRFGLAVGL